MPKTPPNPGSELNSNSNSLKHGSDETGTKRKPRRWVALSVFFGTLLLALFIYQCPKPPLPPVTLPVDTLKVIAPPKAQPDAPPVTPEIPKAKPPVVKPALITPTLPDSIPPYIYADPWGGRHFDSVTVGLFCREGCLLLYSLTDSLNFVTYEKPLTLRRNTAIWITGVDAKGFRLPAIRIEYVIEKNTANCPAGMMSIKPGSVCMDEFEWPNREGEIPLGQISQKAATDSCASIKKRLCSLEEWQKACAGPDLARYPYATPYNEKYCPAKEPAAARSGRFPVCRSYYGNFDMTGNLWEWTSTEASEREGFFWVVGGNWEAGDQATCGFQKYSFYPQNQYPSVGFRCCAEGNP